MCCVFCVWVSQNDDAGFLLDEHDPHDEVPEIHSTDKCPSYWDNQDLTKDFDDRVDCNAKDRKQLQTILDQTWRDIFTRDRNKDEPHPTGLQIVSAHRVEDRAMWAGYLDQKRKIQENREHCTPFWHLDGDQEHGFVKTHLEGLSDVLDESINELYLFHGSSPEGAQGISEDGFRIDMAGSNAGTMFGKGAYFAECCSKSDEYSREGQNQIFKGLYALLLCRVCCGEMFRIDRSDIPAINAALKSGDYDSVLGDREASVNTYREFVVFRERQIYPEYVIIYRRLYDDSDDVS